MENHFERDNFDQFFRDKLEHYVPQEEIPAWQVVAAGMNPIVPRKRRFLPYAAAVLLLLAGGAATFLLTNQQNSEPTIALVDQPQQPQTVEEIVSQLSTSPSEPLVRVNQPVNQLPSSKAAFAANHTNQDIKVSQPVHLQDTTVVIPVSETPVHKVSENDVEQPVATLSAHDVEQPVCQHNQMLSVKVLEYFDEKPVQLNLIASNGLTGGPSQSIGNVSLQDISLREKDNLNGQFMTEFDHGDISNYDHHLPLRLGLGVSFGLTKRLSLNTGLTYSLLKSSFSQVENQAVNGTQSLQYLAIPIFLQALIYHTEKFDIYGAVGMESNFNLKTKVEFSTLTDSHRPNDSNAHVVWGIGMKMGAYYRFWNKTGLFVEPELMHYQTASAVESYWTQEPIAFAFNLGIRTSF